MYVNEYIILVYRIYYFNLLINSNKIGNNKGYLDKEYE